jgi:hypothetical protein
MHAWLHMSKRQFRNHYELHDLFLCLGRDDTRSFCNYATFILGKIVSNRNQTFLLVITIESQPVHRVIPAKAGIQEI